MEVLAKSHPIVMHRQTFYENFIHILLAAEEFKKTNKEFVTLIRMINHTSNSFHGIAPYSAESYEKNLLIEHASSEKDLPAFLPPGSQADRCAGLRRDASTGCQRADYRGPPLALSQGGRRAEDG